MKTDKEKVVYATICKKCESIVKEVVDKITSSDAKEKMDKNPNVFFKYDDKFHKASFRSIIEVSSCGRC